LPSCRCLLSPPSSQLRVAGSILTLNDFLIQDISLFPANIRHSLGAAWPCLEADIANANALRDVFGWQLRSEHLEQQLAASREECAAISNGLLEALSAISRRTSQENPAKGARQSTDDIAVAAATAIDEPVQERLHALQQICDGLEQLLAAEKLRSAELHTACLAAEERCTALDSQLKVQC
jgi:hypothetical protein